MSDYRRAEPCATGLGRRLRIMSIFGLGRCRANRAPLRGSLTVAAISSLLAICAASLVPGEFRPHTTILPGAFEHVATYGVAAFFLCLAYHRRLSPIRLVLFLTTYGALLELGQLWVPGRHGQLSDVMADFAGASIGVSIASALGAFAAKRMAGARWGLPDPQQGRHRPDPEGLGGAEPQGSPLTQFAQRRLNCSVPSARSRD